jgi:hypothetical protein
LAGGSIRRTSPLRSCIAAVIDWFASRSTNTRR